MFFNGHSMESLPVINLYGQLMTLIELYMVIQCFSCFFPLWHSMKFMLTLILRDNSWQRVFS